MIHLLFSRTTRRQLNEMLDQWKTSVTAMLKEWSQIILDRSGLAEYDDWQARYRI
jgi:hypothetical protein